MAFGAGDGLLAAGNEHGVRLYDIRNLASPVLVGALADPGAVVRAAFRRGHLYTSTVRKDKCCLETWVLTDGATPRRIASTDIPAAATHLDQLGSRLCAQYEQGPSSST